MSLGCTTHDFVTDICTLSINSPHYLFYTGKKITGVAKWGYLKSFLENQNPTKIR